MTRVEAQRILDKIDTPPHRHSIACLRETVNNLFDQQEKLTDEIEKLNDQIEELTTQTFERDDL